MAVSKIKDPKTGKVTGYRAEVYVSGVRVADRVFDTKAAAHHWHDETRSAAKLGYSAASKTFGMVLEDYEKGPFSRTRYVSKLSKGHVLEKYLKRSPLVRLKMDEISPHHISEWLKWMKAQPNHSPLRVNFHEEMTFLLKVMNWYRDNYNPRFAVPVMKSQRTEEIKFRPKKNRRPDYYLKPDEVKAFLGEMSRCKRPAYNHLAILMVYTGLRVSEAAALEWHNVHLAGANSHIRICDSLAWDRPHKHRPFWTGTTKNKSSNRIVRIPKILVELLTSIKNQGIVTMYWPNLEGVVEKRQPVFSAKDKPLIDINIRNHFRKAFKKIGTDWSGTHIARHTFGTLSLVATRDMPSIQAALGHASEGQTRHYAKIIALQFGDSVEKLSGLIEGEQITHEITHKADVRLENVSNIK